MIDPSLPELEPFGVAEPAREPAGDAWHAPVRVFNGEAPLGSYWPWVDCRWGEGGYRLTISGAGCFTVSGDGRRIACESRPEVAAGYVEAVLGPALILALALRGVWCLHGSAVATDGGVVAFLGESGAGKSTLARELPALGRRTYERVADDILPVTIDAGEARVLPRFPQLKCPPDAQPGLEAPSSLPLAAVYVLGEEASGVDVVRLKGFEAALAVVRHSVATLLFTPELTTRHMDFCVHVTDRVPIRRLAYPRTLTALPRVAKIAGV